MYLALCAAPWYRRTERVTVDVTVDVTADVTGNQGLVRTANRCAQIPAQTFRSLPASRNGRPPPSSRLDWTTPLFARHHPAPHMAQALRLSKRTEVGTSRQAGQDAQTCSVCPQEYSHAAQGRSLPDKLDKLAARPPACHLPNATLRSASPELPRPARTLGHSGVGRSGRAAILKLSGLSEARRSVPGLASGPSTRCTDSNGPHGKKPAPSDGRCSSSCKKLGRVRSCDCTTMRSHCLDVLDRPRRASLNPRSCLLRTSCCC